MCTSRSLGRENTQLFKLQKLAYTYRELIDNSEHRRKILFRLYLQHLDQRSYGRYKKYASDRCD